jgi:hypothetical protein
MPILTHDALDVLLYALCPGTERLKAEPRRQP